MKHFLTRYKCHRDNLFPVHEPMDTLLRGIKNKKYYRGVLRCRAGGRGGEGRDDCYVVVHSSRDRPGDKKKSNSPEERWSVTITGTSSVEALPM